MSKKITLTDFIEKLNIEPVYLHYKFEDLALKFSPKSREVIVNDGENKWTIDSGETIAVEACLELNEISKDEFESFQSKKLA